MKSWYDFSLEEPELATLGKQLLFRARIGLAFLATLRKDGAPRLHPVSLVIFNDHLYVLIPSTSPKCADLRRDGRYALQAFPSSCDDKNEEFFISGFAETIQDTTLRNQIITGAKIMVGRNELFFELMLDRAMHSSLENVGTPEEKPVHKKWRAISEKTSPSLRS